MESKTPTVTVSLTFEGERPFVNLKVSMPSCVKDSDKADALKLLRELREEFLPDYEVARRPSWSDKAVELIPRQALEEYLQGVADEIPFPIQKMWDRGYDTRGKTVAQVLEENRDLCKWFWGKAMQTDESHLSAADKLGLVAMSLLLEGE